MEPFTFSFFLLVVGVVAAGFGFYKLRSPYETNRTKVAAPLSRSEIFDRAMGYRLGDLSERIAELSYPGFATGDELESELRKFLAVVAADSGTYFRLPDHLKEPWKLLVADHEAYRNITQALLGEGGAIEIQTVTGTKIFKPDEEREKYEKTYARLFGSLSPLVAIDEEEEVGPSDQMKLMRARPGRYTKTWQKDGEKVDTAYLPGSAR